VNQVALVGNITDDPELRYTQSGAALAGFTVAVSHRSKHNDERQDVNDERQDVNDERQDVNDERQDVNDERQDINDGFFRCTAWRMSPRMQRTPSRRPAGGRGRRTRPAQLAGHRRQQASGRRDPGLPRWAGSSVRYRRGS
jgi:hypothetical protein